jgi:ATP-dependent Clp protease protease subunit
MPNLYAHRRFYTSSESPTIKEDVKKKRNDDEDDDDLPIFAGSQSKILDRFTPTIFLSGAINEGMARQFRDAVRELEYVRKSDIALVVIDSHGGYVIDGYKILNTMKASGIEFMTYCTSHAYSMGAAILSAGAKNKRFMAPLSHAMVHQISAGAGGHIEEMRVEMKHLERMNRMVMDEVASNCGLTLAELEEKIRATGSTDLFLDPWEAKKLGLVDEVGWVSLNQARAYQLEVETVGPPKKTKCKPTDSKDPVKVKVVPEPDVEPKPWKTPKKPTKPAPAPEVEPKKTPKRPKK